MDFYEQGVQESGVAGVQKGLARVLRRLLNSGLKPAREWAKESENFFHLKLHPFMGGVILSS
jgi:hypothetical protein